MSMFTVEIEYRWYISLHCEGCAQAYICNDYGEKNEEKFSKS